MRIIKTTDKDCLEINVIGLSRCEPILWFYNGMFCVIPIQVIKNVYEQADMYKRMPLKTLYPKLLITWDQGIPVDSKVGYALLGEQSSN